MTGVFETQTLQDFPKGNIIGIKLNDDEVEE